MDLRDFVDRLTPDLFLVLGDAVMLRRRREENKSLTDEEKRLVQDGMRVHAVKAIRARMGADLKTAIDMVRAFEGTLNLPPIEG